MTSVASTAATLAFVVFLGAGTAFGQSAHDQHHPQQAPAGQGMPMQPGTMGQGMGPGMMGQMPGMMVPGMMGSGMHHGMMGQMGPGMMGPGMMGPGMDPGMMGQMSPGMMGPGMMGPGMMGQMGPGMMGPGMMGPRMGPGMMMGHGMHGFRVVPMMHLSTDDVRQFLQRHISDHGLTHLQVGDVTENRRPDHHRRYRDPGGLTGAAPGDRRVHRVREERELTTALWAGAPVR
jgi:hypothetical protein